MCSVCMRVELAPEGYELPQPTTQYAIYLYIHVYCVHRLWISLFSLYSLYSRLHLSSFALPRALLQVLFLSPVRSILYLQYSISRASYVSHQRTVSQHTPDITTTKCYGYCDQRQFAYIIHVSLSIHCTLHKLSGICSILFSTSIHWQIAQIYLMLDFIRLSTFFNIRDIYLYFFFILLVCIKKFIWIDNNIRFKKKKKYWRQDSNPVLFVCKFSELCA